MKRKRTDRYTGPTCMVLDVSKWQGEIDWGKVAASGRIELVIIRTGDGKDIDSRAVEYLRGASGAGLEIAVYHYVRARHGAAVNVAVIREVLSEAGVLARFVALDVEGRPDDPRTPDTDESRGAWLGGCSTLRVLDVLSEMVATLAIPVIMYAGQAWHWHIAEPGLAGPEWAHLDLWIPDYARGASPRIPSAPWDTWALWQHTSKGRVAGIKGRVDLSRFRGDADALGRWLGRMC